MQNYDKSIDAKVLKVVIGNVPDGRRVHFYFVNPLQTFENFILTITFLFLVLIKMTKGFKIKLFMRLDKKNSHFYSSLYILILESQKPMQFLLLLPKQILFIPLHNCNINSGM